MRGPLWVVDRWEECVGYLGVGGEVGVGCGVATHKFSLTRLEPTRTGVGSPGAKMESVVGVRRQEPEVWRRGEMARRE